MFLRRRTMFALIALFGAIAPLSGTGCDADIIRGRVVGPDKKPVENVTVTATSLVNQTSRNAEDEQGRPLHASSSTVAAAIT